MIVDAIDFPDNGSGYTQFVLVLEHVYVTPRGYVLDRDMEVIPEANFSLDFWRKVPSTQAPRPRLPLVRNDLGDRPAIKLPAGISYVHALSNFAGYNFGHFWDVIQPLMKIEQLALERAMLLVSAFHSEVNDVDRHFELFGYPARSRFRVKGLTYVPRLYVASPATYPSRVTPGTLAWLRRRYAAGRAAVPEAADIRLYLSRKGLKREVRNEEEVRAFVRDRGFEVLNGDEPLERHMAMFARASLVVGPHGSMFRNMIYCDQPCRMLEFCPENRTDDFGLALAAASGIDYTWVRLPGDADHGIRIDTAAIQRFLDGSPPA